MNDTTDTRQQILEAAMERIVHYGYSKTTMSEIAKDCNMSAGNIYRFFASKLDIAEAIGRKFNSELYQTYASICRKPITAADRLRQFFEFSMVRTYEALEEKDKLVELAETLADERPLFMNEQLAQERVYLVQILENGIEAGEFRPLDRKEETAEMIQASMMKFRFPQMFSHLTLPKLKRELAGVMDLVLAGLSAGAVVPERQIDKF
ncbi:MULTISPECIES: TetR/AcrR family transcriptional regulator [unclassified Hyphomonas]|jgi:AcrR family transcriptional regulator|uniref:Transcriptional regulator, TetR family n=1 Tax=hydrothermal vent metagenome TaxID=652676 RepID=A0A160TZ76_9ZZZZ|nr:MULTISPECIES: TetR/AcrR family transcriptional regulator [unclassified Hyphomonas]MAN90396.1 TetR family transcriptional regulator [Hyphomonadaceae bacterium]MAA81661.1 TetR family transcriptional regulator [Hyphomonas sp.]MAL44026.1 TetR family transcriptional regulator [Hyphomonas sp.]MAX84414.1 TetR family transcriptional regulator [Hyphomonas sp.]MBG67424.1 TetR family transcriptional regulator [Hyphomonas sp.]|tara:strand:+ start:6946 stop:7566 length:621 start_codon:yes stop_codon:yes gene_type:complete